MQGEEEAKVAADAKGKAELLTYDADRLIPIDLHGNCQVLVHHELPNGGGTGVEFKEKLLVKESKWYTTTVDASGLNVVGWIKYIFNRPVMINGFAVMSANDCPHRDPCAIRFLAKKFGVEHEDSANLHELIKNFFEMKKVEDLKFESRHQMVKYGLDEANVVATEVCLLIDKTVCMNEVQLS